MEQQENRFEGLCPLISGAVAIPMNVSRNNLARPGMDEIQIQTQVIQGKCPQDKRCALWDSVANSCTFWEISFNLKVIAGILRSDKGEGDREHGE